MTNYAIDYDILFALEISGESDYLIEVKRTDVPKSTPNRLHWLLMNRYQDQPLKLTFVSMNQAQGQRLFKEGSLWFDEEKGGLTLNGEKEFSLVRVSNDKKNLPSWIVQVIDRNLDFLFNPEPAAESR